MKIHIPFGTTRSGLQMGPHSPLAPSSNAPAPDTHAESGGPLEALLELARWQAEEDDAARLAVRWPLERMPLAVAVEAHPDGLDVQKCLAMAFRQWEAAGEGLVRFRFADALANPENADILIGWQADPVAGREFEVGHTDRTVRGKRIMHARITLILQPRIDAHLNAEQRKMRLFATALHEVGHALGLEHSDQATDVMHHRGWQRTLLSRNDAERLKRLYGPAARLLG